MKISIFQRSWFNIAFHELGIKLSRRKIATSSFYKKFYASFSQKYKNYDDCPGEYLRSKEALANYLACRSVDCKSICSIGCGIGYIEYKLSKVIDAKIIGVDNIGIARLLAPETKNLEFLTSLDHNCTFDMVYSVQLLYAMTDTELHQFFNLVRRLLKPDGLYICVETSSRPSENACTKVPILADCKYVFSSIFRISRAYLNMKQEYQFWGWQRSNKKIKLIAEESGLKLVQTSCFQNQSILTFKIH